MIDVRIASNEDGDPVSMLIENLKRVVRFTCVAAFAKGSGYDLISRMIQARVAGGMRATFVVGIDFFQTEPELLDGLLHPKVRYPGLVQAYMGAEKREFTMRPRG